MMRIMILLAAAALLLTGAARAAGVETPPALMLDDSGITETPTLGNYAWSYPTGSRDEWTGVEACGMAPTDPAAQDTFGQVLLMEDRTYTIRWGGTPPDELIVFSWDAAVFSDPDHIDDYEENPEIILRRDGGTITLRPDRVYDFQAKWRQAEGTGQPYGNAHYGLVTQRLIMEDGPGSVMMGGWTPAADFAVTEERAAVFAKGTETLTGARYIPVAYLGSQVVAGTNHAFLCQTAAAYPGSLETAPAFAVVYLYEDLQGNVTLLNAADFEIGSLCTYGGE